MRVIPSLIVLVGLPCHVPVVTCISGSYMGALVLHHSSQAPYSASNPLPLDVWRQQSSGLDLHEQGQLLAKLCWEAQGATVVDPDSLDNLPDAVLSVVQCVMVGIPEPRPEWDPLPEDERLVTPQDTIPAYPSANERNGLSYSIIAASVDEQLTWRVLVMIQDQDGNVVGPSVRSGTGLLRAPALVRHPEEFAGVHITVRSSRRPLPEAMFSQSARWELSLLLSPVLEQHSLLSRDRSLPGKLSEIATSVLHSSFPGEAQVECQGSISPRERSARLVVKPKDPALGVVAVDYAQAHGVLGDFTTHGPFRPFSHTLSERIVADAKNTSLEARARNLCDGLVVQAKELTDDISVSGGDVSYSLFQAGLAPLAVSDKVVMHDLRLQRYDERCGDFFFDVIASVQRNGEFLLPGVDAQGVVSPSEEGLLFSWRVKNLRGASVSQFSYNAMRRLLRAAKIEGGPSLEFDYIGTLVSPEGFARSLEALASEAPERSPLYAPIARHIAEHFKALVERFAEPLWRSVTFDFMPDAEDDHQRVSVLIRHSFGFSRFTVLRPKDTGFIIVNSDGSDSDIIHRNSFEYVE